MAPTTIDYDKLKVAHLLCDKLKFESFSFDMWYRREGPFFLFTFEDDEGMTNEFESTDIDDLIAKIKELATERHKYKVGDTVAYVDCMNLPQEFNIEGLCRFHLGSPVYWENKEDGVWHLESELYPSKESLVGAQIKHWMSLVENID